MSQTNPTQAQATAYAENFILYGDKTRAFRVAFPDSKASQASQNTKAYDLHSVVEIQLRIEELQKTLKKQSTEEFTLSVSELKKHLEDAITKGLASKETRVGDSIMDGGPASISGAVSAIAEINKMDGNYAATRLALGGDPGNPIKVKAKTIDVSKLSDSAISELMALRNDSDK